MIEQVFKKTMSRKKFEKLSIYEKSKLMKKGLVLYDGYKKEIGEKDSEFCIGCGAPLESLKCNYCSNDYILI